MLVEKGTRSAVSSRRPGAIGEVVFLVEKESAWGMQELRAESRYECVLPSPVFFFFFFPNPAAPTPWNTKDLVTALSDCAWTNVRRRRWTPPRSRRPHNSPAPPPTTTRSVWTMLLRVSGKKTFLTRTVSLVDVRVRVHALHTGVRSPLATLFPPPPFHINIQTHTNIRSIFLHSHMSPCCLLRYEVILPFKAPLHFAPVAV